jgi:adenosylcobinamide-phosphate synthase
MGRSWITGSVARSLGAAGGLALDRLLGEPPASVHPVARFGAAMTALEQHTYRDGRGAGALHSLIGAGGAATAGWGLQRVLGRGPSTAVAVAISVGGRMLTDEAAAVDRLLGAHDLAGARQRIRSLVGRDTADLGTDQLARATIESLAENTVDAVTAPLVWATLGGAPAVLAHRAINTLDAMVGHRDDRYLRFGWASARADDVANWLPARLSALGIAVLAWSRAADVIGIVRRDAGQHPSPNGGIIEAAFAAALGISLGGTNVYRGRVEARGVLGDGRSATPADIAPAIILARRLPVGLAAALVASSLTVATLRRVRGRSPRRRSIGA